MPRRKRSEGTRAPNGAGSIYLGQDGKWHGRVTMGVLDMGGRTVGTSSAKPRLK
ncbi:hypothetical protein Amsp01_056320 [Amycolatopsis sp. NBRC 101858]|nr:hypothetical protein Amsp01_056320 [Amycolatopsis sp. NBRC 101858]